MKGRCLDIVVVIISMKTVLERASGLLSAIPSPPPVTALNIALRRTSSRRATTRPPCDLSWLGPDRRFDMRIERFDVPVASAGPGVGAHPEVAAPCADAASETRKVLVLGVGEVLECEAAERLPTMTAGAPTRGFLG